MLEGLLRLGQEGNPPSRIPLAARFMLRQLRSRVSCLNFTDLICKPTPQEASVAPRQLRPRSPEALVLHSELHHQIPSAVGEARHPRRGCMV